MRTAVRAALLASLALVMALIGTTPAPAQELTIGGYTLVSSQRVTRTVFDYTYRAQLSNPGPAGGLAALGVTAQVMSLSPATQIVDGTLSFGDVPAGGAAASVDTFTIRQDRAVAFNPAALAWTINARRELAVPESWAGAWHITLTYRDATTGAVTAVEETDGVIRADEPFGLGFSGPLAACHGGLSDTRLTLHCTLASITTPCSISGSLDLLVDRAGDTLTGTGAWGASGLGCTTPVDGGQTLAITGIRLSPDPGPAPASPSTLLRRFVSQPLFVIFASSN
jgi:hypothetical protein